jgi:hypothetical protein
MVRGRVEFRVSSSSLSGVLGMRVLFPWLRFLFRPRFLLWPYLRLRPDFGLWPLLRSRPYLRSWALLRGWTLLRRWPHLWSGAFLWSLPYLLHRPLLGRWPHLLGGCCLLHRPFFLSALGGGSRLLTRLHWDQSGLMMLYGKRLRDDDRLRLAAVYGRELGAVCTRLNPVLLLNG